MTEPGRGELRNVYRFGVFVLAVAVSVTSLGARMFYLQVIQKQPAAVAGAADENTEIQSIPASRGLIFASDGTPLVENVVDYAVTVTPFDLPLDQEQLVAQRLGDILDLDPIYVETQIDSATGSLYAPVKIADGVTAQVARFIEENADQLPGVKIAATSKREYVSDPPDLYSELIGYEGRITAAQYEQWKDLGYSAHDIVGQAGLENYYEQALRGTPGSQTVALNDKGQPVPGVVTRTKDPIPGDSLTLNIDPHEQELASQALAWGIKAAKVQQGVIIVENPQNGKILAMVSLPSYNNQLFSDGISATDFQALLTDPTHPLLNKAVGAQFPPGSTFKLVTGTAGIQDSPLMVDGTRFTDTSTLLSQPFIQIGDTIYREWNRTGWGPLNITMGVAHSSDTFFYQLSELVGLDRLTYWADQYGFGKQTHIDLPETAWGDVPTDAWKLSNVGERMYEGELAQAGIGQGYDETTPMQLLNAYCALANGGNLWQPQIVKSITNGLNGEVKEVQPVLLNKLPASEQTLQTMRLATRAVVTSRHTSGLVDIGINVAGKTGTAEFGNYDKSGRLPYHEWFVGYTPADPYHGDFSQPDSQLAVISFIYGGDTYANVSTEVVKLYMMLHYKLIKRQSQAFLHTTPGYIPSWVYRTTNFYGNPNRD